MRFPYILFTTVYFVIFPFVLLAEETEISELDCFIEPFTIVNVGSGVTGIIAELTVDRGDFVEKGQVLARLDSRVEEATLDLIRARSEMVATIEARKARLEFAVRERKRKDELYIKDIIALGEIDEAETNVLIARQELEEAKEQQHIATFELKQALESVERRIIRSSIKGVVVEKFLSIGELVEEKPILQLAQIDPLNVEVIAPLSLLGSIKVGDKAEVMPEDPVNGVYAGKVKIVDRVIDAASGTFGIRIEIPNTDYSLPAGLKCRVRFLGR